ncbi:MAG: hypothetical protein LUG60_04155 [Erysipelotrichaceae bacterium]|nr:hypothetical protein [Erysipelotrichaceae bacterium]
MVLCAIAIVLDKYKEYYYQFHQVCMIRMSFKKYLFLNIKQIFLHTIFYMIVLHGLLLIFDCLYFQSPLVAEYGDYCYFVYDQTINLLIFIVLSCLGTSLFNIFLYSLSIYINNIYVFIVSPIIILFISFIIASSVSSLFSNIIDSIIGIELIGQSFAVGLMTSTLIEPGVAANYPYVAVVTSFIIYGLISIVDYIYTRKKLEIG